MAHSASGKFGSVSDLIKQFTCKSMGGIPEVQKPPNNPVFDWDHFCCYCFRVHFTK